jgi:hypothetical protein
VRHDQSFFGHDAGAVVRGRFTAADRTAGKTRFIAMPNGQVQACTKYRDFDGRIRLVSKNGRSRAAAERTLKTELANRQTSGRSGAIGASIHVSDPRPALAGRPACLVDRYRADVSVVVSNQVVPAPGELRLPRGDGWLG